MRKLGRSEIIILRSLFSRGATTRPLSLLKWQREYAVPLWRRELIEIWYRQSASGAPSWEGPFYRLTTAGEYLAAKFFPAPRGLSGAGQAT